MASRRTDPDQAREVLFSAASALLLELKVRKPKHTTLVEAIIEDDLERQSHTDGWAVVLGNLDEEDICVALWYDKFLGPRDGCFWTGFEFGYSKTLKKFVGSETILTRISSSDVTKGRIGYVKTGVVPEAERFPAVESFQTGFHGYGIYDRGLSSKNEGTRLDVSRAASFVFEATSRFFKADFEEGAMGQVTRVQRERDPRARAACLRKCKKPYRCVVCDLCFEERYGSRGKDFIHVHHVEPLGSTGLTVTNAEKDLVPVCPNCHSMLHREPLMTPNELKKLLRSKS